MTIDLVDEDTAGRGAPPSSTPTRAVPASAAEELDGEYASYDAPAPASRVEHLDPDEASFASALAAATTARARAEEARRFATQKTAKATALTMQAKELLDVAAGARGEPRPASAHRPPQRALGGRRCRRVAYSRGACVCSRLSRLCVPRERRISGRRADIRSSAA